MGINTKENNYEIQNLENNIVKENLIKEKNNFSEDIKVNIDDINNVVKKNNILEELNNNKEALNMLSIERLKKLEKYYDDIIKKNNEKIEKLKKST